jgi:hypothetical protein
LNLDEQARSQFRYRYSCYQLEYSRPPTLKLHDKGARVLFRRLTG